MDKKLPMPIIILVVVNIFAMLAVGGMLYVAHKKDKDAMTMKDIVRGEEEEKEAKEMGLEEVQTEEELPVYELDAFTVNLADIKETRYARVNIKLELSNVDVEDELERRTPQVRDLIIILLSSKRYSDIQTSEGKNKLRDEIVKSINSYLVKGEVKNLYFTNFVVN